MRSASTEAARGAECDILNLVLGPLDLNLLGLEVHLKRVVLDIVAVPGAGNLLGNLLCAVAGLLDGTPLSNLQLLRLANRVEPNPRSARLETRIVACCRLGTDAQPAAAGTQPTPQRGQEANVMQIHAEGSERHKQLRRKLGSLPAIEQAKGIIMSLRRCDQDTAFAELLHASQQSDRGCAT